MAWLQGLDGDGVGDEEEVCNLAASTLHKPMSLLDRWQACSSTAQVSRKAHFACHVSQSQL